MIDLIPYTKYEFLLQSFTRGIPSDYSNSITTTTLDTVPQKIENLHGYRWNETSVVVHWIPPNSTNGPNFVRKFSSNECPIVFKSQIMTYRLKNQNHKSFKNSLKL